MIGKENKTYIIVTDKQLETIFEIAKNFGGKYLSAGRLKSERQKFWRLRAINVNMGGERGDLVWNISEDGDAASYKPDNPDMGFKSFRWVPYERRGKKDGK